MAKNVLILSPFFSPNTGGVETHLDDLCKYLSIHGFYVYVLTYQPLTTKTKGASYEKKKNLEIRRLTWFGYNFFHKLEPCPPLEFLYLFPRFFVATLSFMILNHQKIDVIHAHGLIAATITRLVTLIYPKRAVLSIHAIYQFGKRPLMAKIVNWILSGFETVFPLAQASREDLRRTGLSTSKIKFCNQWVNQSLFRIRNKDSSRQKLNLKGDFFVLFVGRLLEKKGVEILTQVAQELLKIEFVFVGDGPMMGELKRQEKKQSNIHVAGRKTQKEAALYYGAADLIAVPSQYKEGFARVVPEALSSGRPVIVSNKGCLPEMITEEVGILVAPNKEEIKKAIIDLYQDSKHLKKLTENSRPYAEKNFSEKNAAQIARVYLKN